MPAPRTLRITIEVEDDGEDESYDQIMRGLLSIGAEVVDEEEV